eukprot:3420442-Pyramimonas_sp.AAC.1
MLAARALGRAVAGLPAHPNWWQAAGLPRGSLWRGRPPGHRPLGAGLRGGPTATARLSSGPHSVAAGA